MAGKSRSLAPLLDFSFTELVTERMAGTLYGAAVGGLGTLTVIVVAYGFARHPALGLMFATVSAAGFLVSVLVVRVWLEAAVVLVRIAEQTEELAEQVAGIAVEVARNEGHGAGIGAKSRPS